MPSIRPYCYLFFLSTIFWISSCNSLTGASEEEEILPFNTETSRHIQSLLSIATEKNGTINDSLMLDFTGPVEDYYYNNEYLPVWCDTGALRPYAKEFIKYLDVAILDGLIKYDYHYTGIQQIMKMLRIDSSGRKDNKILAQADIMLTDAFMHIICDLKQGRLQSDSLSWKNDTTKFIQFFGANLDSLRKGKDLNQILSSCQPDLKEYLELKRGIGAFIKSMDKKKYIYLKYPYKKGDINDSLFFIKSLKQRLIEGGYTGIDKPEAIDSAGLRTIILNYQKNHNLYPDGIPGVNLVKSLNTTDFDKFIRICITLDRYKILSDNLPKNYIGVNLPAFKLKVFENDSVRLESKIICGKPSTPTPLLNSKITDMIIYPTWTIPTSIISKEILPGLKKNTAYLSKKGYKLLNRKGESIDPDTINWQKFSKGLPYLVQQPSGNQNALGIMKFNFQNPYDVYLHDTNQRYLFNNSFRALSHGCVRVQEWQKLAFYIAQKDSIESRLGASVNYNCDSISNWLSYKKRREIKIKNQIPLFISYYTCEGFGGKIIFHDDIYNDDSEKKTQFFKKNTTIF